MKASRMLISTLKETPSEAVIPSHILLLRSGMIRKEVAGVYNYLPLGLRVLNKVEDVIREEMNNAGSLEILASAIQPKELWEESGRWYKYGPELMRLKDRHGREFCLGPTHEEIFTDLVRNEVKSKKQLPMSIYQIQTKYRDEFRPRFGLMRSREFIMKDAYSFDVDVKGLEESYQNMYDTYTRIFNRFHLKFVPVLADTGAIGGNGSHQFMALSEYGESDIIYCEECGYAADQEKAETKPDTYRNDEVELPKEEVATPCEGTIEDLAKFLKCSPKDIAKSVLYRDLAHKQLVLVLVRGDREVNEIKIVNALDCAEFELVLASDEDLKSLGTSAGFMGPIGLNVDKILVDEELVSQKNFFVGANKKDFHIKNVNFGRDFTGEVAQFRKSVAGDLCKECGKPVKMERGIEVGQIFKLGTKYSEPMKCTYTDDDGTNKPMVMGCYGIGVTRTMSAIIDQYHDDFGIKWPLNVAPYHAVVVPVNYKDETQKNVANDLYKKLLDLHVEVVLDDRDERPGFKFKDWELIGLPFMVIVGKRASEGIVEFKDRATLEKKEVTIEEVVKLINEAVKSI